MRSPRQADAWDHPTTDGVAWPEVTTDADRDVVGTILGPSGDPMHTVKRSGAVEFGFHRPKRPKA